MHLQLNLSNQLIKQWKPELTAEPPETHPLLQWRIDKIKLANTTANYICVNEATLFSFLLPRLPGKKQLQVQQYFADRLLVILEEFFFPPPALQLADNLPVLYGKTKCKRMIGTVTDMRFRYDLFYCKGLSLPEAEERVNNSPTQGPDYRWPIREFIRLREQFDDPYGSLLTFKMPAELVYAARQSLYKAVPPALLCLSKDSEDDNAFIGRVTLADLMVFHNAVQEVLQQPGSFEIKKKLFPVSTYLGDILSAMYE
jgi:hypothetical protein